MSRSFALSDFFDRLYLGADGSFGDSDEIATGPELQLPYPMDMDIVVVI
jgi:hypothetical protein